MEWEALPPPETKTRYFWKRAWKLRAGIVGFLLVFSMVLCALFAPYIAPYDPYEQDIFKRLVPPVWDERGGTDHLLGTDQLGRDILSRIIFGSRISLSVGIIAVLIAGTLGVLLGLIAGYYGGRIDTIISFAVNVMLSFPTILLAMAIVAVLGPSFTNMFIVLGITGWPIYTRVVRAEVYNYREREFTLAARALGMWDRRIMLRHILPNLINTIVVLATVEVARMIIRESFLSFLGLGIPPPTPSWGVMLSEGRAFMLGMWWLATFPGMAIFLTTLGINLLGDGLRDLLDPYAKDK
ncbi:MAG: ABC transporter permease [Nitrospinota bacterium]|nr:MAG: ABC transporter permease [Nitrospinota bacterium]